MLQDPATEEIHVLVHNNGVEKQIKILPWWMGCHVVPFWYDFCNRRYPGRPNSCRSKATIIKRGCQNGQTIMSTDWGLGGRPLRRMDDKLQKLQSFQKYCFQVSIKCFFYNWILFPFFGRTPVKLCGFSGSHSYFSEGSYLHITFHSDGSEEDKGFSIEVQHFMNLGKWKLKENCPFLKCYLVRFLISATLTDVSTILRWFVVVLIMYCQQQWRWNQGSLV